MNHFFKKLHEKLMTFYKNCTKNQPLFEEISRKVNHFFRKLHEKRTTFLKNRTKNEPLF